MESRAQRFEQEWNVEFHGTKYIVLMIANEYMMEIELENVETDERWRGEFTAQHIEANTIKAGYAKRLSEFVDMLSQAFSESNAQLNVNILTYSELMVLKAKHGKQTDAPNLDTSIAQTRKRYLILSYRGPFDKRPITYPLTLPFEEQPNPTALKRTIARLRKKVIDMAAQEREPANERERDLQQVAAKLRQENQELKHRVRQGGSALNLSTASALANHTAPSPGRGVTAELAGANAKLRKENQSLRKELSELSHALEAQRTDFAKQLARWKQRIGTSGADATPYGTHTALIAELRAHVKLLQQELGEERLRRGANPSPSRKWSPSTRRLVNDSAASWRAGSSSHSRPASTGRSTSAEIRRPSSTSRPWSTGETPSSSRWNGIASGRGTTPTPVLRSTSAPRSREVSPALRQRGKQPVDYGNGHHSAPGSGSRRSSPALASTLGGRFDPTAYQQDRAMRAQQALHSRAWGAGSGSTPVTSARHRYQSPHGADSGYNSANSQSSRGSRRSERSQRSASVASTASKASSGRPKKKASRKARADSPPRATKAVREAPRAPSATTSGGHRPAAGRSPSPARVTGQASAHSAGGDHTRKDREIGRLNAQYRDSSPLRSRTGPSQLQQQQQVSGPAAAKHPHRRSRESPDGDSETDDSEFLPQQKGPSAPTNAPARRPQQEAEEMRGSSEHRRPSQLPVPTPPSATKSTAYNTYLNVLAGKQPEDVRRSRQEPARRSDEKLMSLAEERSSYLVREEEGSESEPSLRRNSAGDRSFDRLRASGDHSLSRTAELRASLESHLSAVTASTVASHPSRVPQKQQSAGAAQLRASLDQQMRQSGGGLAGMASPGRKQRVASSVASSMDGPASVAGAGGGDGDSLLPNNELEEMDKRIEALQMYLEKARSAL